MEKEKKFQEIMSFLEKEFDNFILLVEDTGVVKGNMIDIGSMLTQACLGNDDFKEIINCTSLFINSEKFKESEKKLMEEQRMKSRKYND